MKIGVAAIAKNEEPYIEEWIAHNLVCGFDKIYIGENESNDKTAEIIARSSNKNPVELIPYPTKNKHPQIPFYDEVIKKARDEIDILLIIDIDEYVFSTKDTTKSTIENLFENKDVSAIAINWCLYGSSGKLTRDDGLLMERFYQHGDETFGPNKHYKCALRLESTYGMLNPHHPAVQKGIINTPAGKPLSILKQNNKTLFGLSEIVDWSTLRINHYFCKSLDEYINIKIKRGLADGPGYRSIDQFHAHDVNERSDFEIIRHIEEVKKRIRDLY